jgi:hypothetical protein
MAVHVRANLTFVLKRTSHVPLIVPRLPRASHLWLGQRHAKQSEGDHGSHGHSPCVGEHDTHCPHSLGASTPTTT